MNLYAVLWMRHLHFAHDQQIRPCFELTDVSLTQSRTEAEQTGQEWLDCDPESLAFVVASGDGGTWVVANEGNLPGGENGAGMEICHDSIVMLSGLLGKLVGQPTTETLHRSLKSK